MAGGPQDRISASLRSKCSEASDAIDRDSLEHAKRCGFIKAL